VEPDLADIGAAQRHADHAGQGTLKVDGTAPDVTVGATGTEAHVIGGNIQTASATVYIIDSVMMPASWPCCPA
jgi:uncharacterized surface protein with fasciclin (FAS1) repeats